MSETIAVDFRSVTISGSTALISIPGAAETITYGGCDSGELQARIEVFDDGDKIRFEGEIDKPDISDLTNVEK